MVERSTMKNSTQDQVAGTTRRLAGNAKEGLGKATGDKELTQEGRKDQVAGKVQKKVGDVKQVFDK